MIRRAPRSAAALVAAALSPVAVLAPLALAGCSEPAGGPVPQDDVPAVAPEEQERIDAEESAI